MNTVAMPDSAAELRTLSNVELVTRTAQLAENERATTVQLLHHLNEIARRKLYLELGYSSLHDYCVRGLHYSSPSACRRIRAARCVREFPDVLRLLERGELDLGTISLIEPVLTEDNHGAVVARVRGRTYRQVKRVVADYGPVLAIAEERIEPVRALVTPSSIDTVLFDRQIERAMPHGAAQSNGSWVVSEQKTLVQFLASEELMQKYEEVKALLSHRHPDASFADVLAILLNEHIARHSPEARQKRRDARHVAGASGGKSPTVGADGGSRHIPAAVRDAAAVSAVAGAAAPGGPPAGACAGRPARATVPAFDPANSTGSGRGVGRRM